MNCLIITLPYLISSLENAKHHETMEASYVNQGASMCKRMIVC